MAPLPLLTHCLHRIDPEALSTSFVPANDVCAGLYMEHLLRSVANIDDHILQVTAPPPLPPQCHPSTVTAARSPRELPPIASLCCSQLACRRAWT